jgi:hypothetical protein
LDIALLRLEVLEAARLLADRGISAVPVVDSRHLPAWLTAVHLDMYCEQIHPDRLSRRPQTPDQCDAPHNRRKPSMIAALAQKMKSLSAVGQSGTKAPFTTNVPVKGGYSR